MHAGVTAHTGYSALGCGSEYCKCARLLPGHEGMQHSHMLPGEIVLLHSVIQGQQMTGYHLHRLYLLLTLPGEPEKSELLIA